MAGTVKGAPTKRAGLRSGDITTAVDGVQTATPEDFLASLRKHNPGDTPVVTAHAPEAADRKVRVKVTGPR